METLQRKSKKSRQSLGTFRHCPGARLFVLCAAFESLQAIFQLMPVWGPFVGNFLAYHARVTRQA